MVSWNVAHRAEPWRELLAGGYDVALLQEAAEPPDDVRPRVHVDSAPWRLGGAGLERAWRSAVVGLSDRVDVRHIVTAPIDHAGPDQLPVSRAGSLGVAEVTVRETGERLFVASLYAAWESPPLSSKTHRWIYGDASCHRLVSDLAALLEDQSSHRIIAAGDLNALRGYGENGSPYWRGRYDTIFQRMEAMGLPCVGPEVAEGETLRAPAPAERPPESRTVPTYRTKGSDPLTATRQLDFVFASRGLAGRVATRALVADEQWGPSDHCRVEIELRPR